MKYRSLIWLEWFDLTFLIDSFSTHSTIVTTFYLNCLFSKTHITSLLFILCLEASRQGDIKELQSRNFFPILIIPVNSGNTLNILMYWKTDPSLFDWLMRLSVDQVNSHASSTCSHSGDEQEVFLSHLWLQLVVQDSSEMESQ